MRYALLLGLTTGLFALACQNSPSVCNTDDDCFKGEVCNSQRQCVPPSALSDTSTEDGEAEDLDGGADDVDGNDGSAEDASSKTDVPTDSDSQDTSPSTDSASSMRDTAPDTTSPDSGCRDPGCPCKIANKSEGVCGDGMTNAMGNCTHPRYMQSEDTHVVDDDKDNDCDGTTDEGTKRAGESCGGPKQCDSGLCDRPSGGNDSVCAHRVFVTSGNFTGNLGGVGGADQTCQRTAERAGLAGGWKAIISGTTPAKNRIAIDARIVNIKGAEVAQGGSTFWGSNLANKIKFDEHLNSRQTKVWTGSTSTGLQDASGLCKKMTSAKNPWAMGSRSLDGAYGQNTASGTGWLNKGKQNCMSRAALYCIDGQ